MGKIYVNGDLLEKEIRDMLVKLRELTFSHFSGMGFQSSSLHYRGLAIWWDDKGYIVDDFKDILSPELKYIADGRKRAY